MSRKQKGKRGKTISVQFMKDEDRAVRAIASSERRSISDIVRMIVIAELDHRKEAAAAKTTDSLTEPAGKPAEPALQEANGK